MKKGLSSANNPWFCKVGVLLFTKKYRHTGKAGVWTHGFDALTLDVWTLRLWVLGLWIVGRLDFGRLDT